MTENEPAVFGFSTDQAVSAGRPGIDHDTHLLPYRCGKHRGAALREQR